MLIIILLEADVTWPHHIPFENMYIPSLPHHVEHAACRWSCKSRISKLLSQFMGLFPRLSLLFMFFFYDFKARVLLYHYEIRGSLSTVNFCYKDLKSMKCGLEIHYCIVVDHKNNQW